MGKENEKLIEIKTNDVCKIALPNTKTKVVEMGNVIELTWQDHQPGAPVCEKIDKDHYMDKRTGEVFNIQHWETRADGKKSIRKTMETIRALINTNVVEPRNCLWCTFTYADNMTDEKQLYVDFKVFKNRFNHYCRGRGLPQPEYISVIEPQGRGAWHIHAFFIWQDAAPYIDNNTVMEKLWPHGFTKTKAVKETDNVGAYFTAYLADIPLDEAENLENENRQKILAMSEDAVLKEFEDEKGLTKKKKFIKGGRLCLYPPGMNIVRYSRGIVKPIVEYMPYEQAEKKATAATVTFERSYIVADEHGVVNTISKAYYNTKRKANQDK